MSRHFWQGQWIAHQDIHKKTKNISESILAGYKVLFDQEEFYRACDRFSVRLKIEQTLRDKLVESLVLGGEANKKHANLTINEVADFLDEKAFRKKVRAEFGTDSPMRSKRVSYESNTFESWFPLGFVVQILASNSPSLSVLSAFEGLVTGNINFIKVSSSASDFTGLLFEEFFQDRVAKDWSPLLMVAKFSSKEKEILQDVMAESDAVVAWGGEEALAQIRLMMPTRARLIEWGHRISFSYLTKEGLTEDSVFQKLALDVFRYDQQACSSPQCIFVENASFSELEEIAQELAATFREQALLDTCTMPTDTEAGEITRIVEVTKIESSLREELTDVVEDTSGKWRILVDSRPGLRASPLYRTIWLKTISREQLLSVLRPLGQYLQTVGLACHRAEIFEISKKLYQAGVTRIRAVGEMLDSYPGEPHDGFPAMPRYMKKVSMEQNQNLNGFATLEDLHPISLQFANWPEQVMGKAEFQNQSSRLSTADLYFKSGGSSGDPKLSLFTYEDYHRQMRLAADGLLAAGLDPSKDRCMNLFFGGGLYGGFLSFFTILEHLNACQFPMSAHLDLQFVGEMIVKNNVNTLLGMPSYLMQLFERNSELFKKHKVVVKIFYGGEHFTEAQKSRLIHEFGIKAIFSASYGSVDMGPLGYQCSFCNSGVHHLHHHLHHLEILNLEKDQPAPKGEVGRLIFSTHGRHGQNLLRYDIGDVGKWVLEDCECGRKSPRFQLLGRHGDIFRAAGTFLNYNRFSQILMENLSYSHEFQIVIDNSQGKDRLRISLDKACALNLKEVDAVLIKNYRELQEVVVDEKSLLIEFELKEALQLDHAPGSGKLRRVVDQRKF